MTGVTPASVGADKGRHNKEFVQYCRREGITPHVAEIKGRKVAGLDGRTPRAPGYKTSPHIRKRIEEILGEGDWRPAQDEDRGIERVAPNAVLVLAGYNLVRMAKLPGSPLGIVAAR